MEKKGRGEHISRITKGKGKIVCFYTFFEKEIKKKERNNKKAKEIERVRGRGRKLERPERKDCLLFLGK